MALIEVAQLNNNERVASFRAGPDHTMAHGVEEQWCGESNK